MQSPRGPAVLTLLFLTFTLFIVGSSLNLGPVARRVPLAVALPTAGLVIAQLVRDLKSRPAAPPVNPELLTLAWTLALPVAILLVGFLIVVPAYTVLYLRFRARERRIAPLMLAAVAVWAVLWGVFVSGLDMPLYQGVVREWLSF